MEINPEKLKRAKKVVQAGSVELAQLEESMAMNEKLDLLLAKEMTFPEQEPFPEIPEFPSEISVSNLPEVQKVEVLNFPKQDAPIVNIEAPKAPIVNVEAPIVEINNKEVVAELKNITEILSQEEGIEKTEIVDAKGEIVDFQKLFNSLSERISNIRIMGGGGSFPTQSQNDLSSLAANYSSRVDTISTSGILYVGSASVGSSESSSVWQISKVDTTGTPTDIKVTWANGNTSFNNAWVDRLTITYS